MTPRTLLIALVILLGVVSTQKVTSQEVLPWRALIIYTNSTDNAAGQNVNMYQDRFLNIFEWINNAYEQSGISNVRASIAGVLWDTTYVGVESGTYELEPCLSETYYSASYLAMASMGSPCGPLRKYFDMMAEYSADIIILVDRLESENTIGGQACPPYDGCLAANSEDVGNRGRIWINGPDIPATSWAHEVGHIHGSGHCDGWRQTFDTNGYFTDTNASRGIHDIMAYGNGNKECTDTSVNYPGFPSSAFDYNDGDTSIVTEHTNVFASPSVYWTHYPSTEYPYPITTYQMGQDSLKNFSGYAVDKHQEYSDSIRLTFSTPTDLTITDSMSLARFDFADLLALNSVNIQSGFHTSEQSKMRITVGTSALSKRGAKSNEKFISEKDLAPKNIGSISNFLAKYDAMSKSMKISFSGGSDLSISFVVFDVKGYAKGRYGEFRSDGGAFSKFVNLNELPNGAYFMQVAVGSNKFYKRFTKR